MRTLNDSARKKARKLESSGNAVCRGARAITFGILLFGAGSAFPQSISESEAYNPMGSTFGNDGPVGDPGSGTASSGSGPETFQAAFEIQSSGKQVKNNCAVCHWLEVQIDGKIYQSGQPAKLLKGRSYEITVKDTPRPIAPNAVIPAEHPTYEDAKFTVYPIAVDGQTISELPGDENQPPLGFIAQKDQVFQYLIDNSEGLLVRDKAWPKSAADEPMNKKASFVAMDIAVDANRDGVIKFAGNQKSTDPKLVGKPMDKTTEAQPYRFWINDDNDGAGDGVETSNAAADSLDGEIKSARDLEDFTRLHLYIGGLHEAITSGTFSIGLEWRNANGSPSLKVYRAAEPNGGNKYLSNENSSYAATLQTATPFKAALGTIDKSEAFKLPADFFRSTGSGIPAFGEDHPTRYLLFEGAGEGKGQLVMTIWRGNKKISEGGSTWVDLVNVKKMYERAKARSNPVDIPDPQESTSTPAVPTIDYVLDPWNNQWEYQPASWTEAKDYIVFVHGWNTPYEDARVLFAESMFKRVWQLGYKGRFAALYWPTLVGITTFNESEYRAWFFGESLQQYVKSLPVGYSKNLVAHSLGNVLGGSALRRGMSIRNYAMLDAAVPASCYDDSARLQQPFGSYSPDHDTDSITQALAYKNKLASVGSKANIINFYLASDDALDAWRLNNEFFRPQIFYSISQNYHGYTYQDWNAPGEKLFIRFIISPTRYLTQMEESLGYAAKSSTYSVGAEGATGGSVAGSVNLGGPGYEDEHSSFWKFNLQKMKTRYNTLMDELGVQRNDE